MSRRLRIAAIAKVGGLVPRSDVLWMADEMGQLEADNAQMRAALDRVEELAEVMTGEGGSREDSARRVRDAIRGDAS